MQPTGKPFCSSHHGRNSIWISMIILASKLYYSLMNLTGMSMLNNACVVISCISGKLAMAAVARPFFLIHYQYTVRLGEKNRGSSKLFWGMFLRFPVLNHYQSLLRINLFSNTNYIVFFCHSSTCKILFYTVGVREKPWVKHKNNINVG